MKLALTLLTLAFGPIAIQATANPSTVSHRGVLSLRPGPRLLWCKQAIVRTLTYFSSINHTRLGRGSASMCPLSIA
jgi:hypothetical protein